MQDNLDHLTVLTAAEGDSAGVPAPEAVEKAKEDVPQVGKANLLEIAQASKKPAQDDESDTFEGV